MEKLQRDVKTFMEACSLPIEPQVMFNFGRLADKPFELIKEEFEELWKALDEYNVLETIDAVCDLIYVVLGLITEIGIDLEPFWDEVQRANMNKTTGPKRHDGKQLKPEGWQPPDHKTIYDRLYGQLTQEGN